MLPEVLVRGVLIVDFLLLIGQLICHVVNGLCELSVASRVGLKLRLVVLRLRHVADELGDERSE